MATYTVFILFNSTAILNHQIVTTGSYELRPVKQLAHKDTKIQYNVYRYCIGLRELCFKIGYSEFP